MRHRGTVPPATLRVEHDDDSVVVTYRDGRRTTYRGPIEPISGPLKTPPGKEVHVIVTDPAAGDGVVIYVNDRLTHDEVLESSGVGRIIVDPGERRQLVPGIDARVEGLSVVIEADPSAVEGRIFVFAEDEFSEHAYEIVPSDR